MATRSIACVVLFGVFCLQPGCVLVESAQVMSRQSLRAFKPRGNDYRNLTEEETDEWSDVGKLGRGNQTREIDPDPWWKKHIMSEKARAIERNLAVD